MAKLQAGYATIASPIDGTADEHRGTCRRERRAGQHARDREQPGEPHRDDLRARGPHRAGQDRTGGHADHRLDRRRSTTPRSSSSPRRPSSRRPRSRPRTSASSWSTRCSLRITDADASLEARHAGGRGAAVTDAPDTREIAIDARDLRREFRSREAGAITAVDDVTLQDREGCGLRPHRAGRRGQVHAHPHARPRFSPRPRGTRSSSAAPWRPNRTPSSRASATCPSSSRCTATSPSARTCASSPSCAGVARAEMAERAARLLEFSGLTEFAERQAQFLSGGMKQKLALAATLISEPDLLFLDEPTTGVDPVSRREFWRIISGLHRQGITVFVATPYMDEAERCDEIAFMTEGRIILRDTPAGVKRRVPGSRRRGRGGRLPQRHAGPARPAVRDERRGLRASSARARRLRTRGVRAGDDGGTHHGRADGAPRPACGDGLEMAFATLMGGTTAAAEVRT